MMAIPWIKCPFFKNFGISLHDFFLFFAISIPKPIVTTIWIDNFWVVSHLSYCTQNDRMNPFKYNLMVFRLFAHWSRNISKKVQKTHEIKKYFPILWKIRNHIHLIFKELLPLLRFWHEKLNCRFFHSFHLLKEHYKATFLVKISA